MSENLCLSGAASMQVMSVPPAPPSDVTLAEQTKDTLTVTWAEAGKGRQGCQRQRTYPMEFVSESSFVQAFQASNSKHSVFPQYCRLLESEDCAVISCANSFQLLERVRERVRERERERVRERERECEK